jgi:HK97 gp10 family phage protein
MGITFKVEGLGDVMEAFEELANEIGDRKAKSKILVPAARDAMKPVLAQAKTNAPKETGALSLLLQVEARRPTKKDRRSKYVRGNDSVIAAVTTASGKKMQQMSEGKGLIRTRKKLKKMGYAKADEWTGFKSDARAIAQEFGTAKHPAQPYLRPALENNAAQTVEVLAGHIRRYIDRYRMKNPK